MELLIMGRWLTQINKMTDQVLTKPTKLSSVSYVSTDSGRFHFKDSVGLHKESTPENKVGVLSFINIPISTFSLLEDFFNQAERLGLELLADDKKWLKSISYGVPLLKLKCLLEEYTMRWIATMKNEQLSHKQQNRGRFAANTFIREMLEKHKGKVNPNRKCHKEMIFDPFTKEPKK